MNQNVNHKLIYFLLILLSISAFADEPVNSKLKEIISISIVPSILGGKADPSSDGIKTLSFQGYGEIVDVEAKKFWLSFNNKKLYTKYVEKGVDLDIIVQFKDKTYENIRLRKTKNSLIYTIYKPGNKTIYILPQECYQILELNLISFQKDQERKMNKENKIYEIWDKPEAKNK